MRFGVAVPAYGGLVEPEGIVEVVRAAERLGYDSAWFADHVAVPPGAGGPFVEPLAACAWGLGATSRLLFGTDVLVVPYRHPVLVAAMAATATRMASPPGRLILGVGIGHLEAEFAALGATFHRRGAVTDASLADLRRALEGRFEELDLLAASVPLWVGGGSDAALRRAALLGDGWHPLWPTPEEYRSARQRIGDRRAAAGIDRPFTWSYGCAMTAVRETRSGPVAASPPWYAPDFPAAADGRLRFAGTVEQLVDDFGELQAVGVDHVVLRFGAVARKGGATAVAEQLEAFGPVRAALAG